ncbi:TetR/AcrR family transcriptional regulator [Aminipila sp.]|uniref:TetR/AcrR family transcriptional regulator n=1 Tax=Aminipila sp. TaxID=2060095 RepID=UPI00289771BE|nr:helix-turn-helix domain-containing protein [Aminipila sp.]
MSRVTDPQKIESVRRAAMEIIVEYGYRGVSIAEIAKKAGVSVGYLYRYYSSKEILLEDLINKNLADVKGNIIKYLKNSQTIDEFFYGLISFLFDLAKEDAVKAQMAATLFIETDFEKVLSPSDLGLKKEVFEAIHKISKETGEIKSDVSEEEIQLTLMTIPFRYIMMKIKEKDFQKHFQEEHIQKIKKLCLNALR